jgi:8-oxo-dGTP diphosphatase
MAYRWITKVGLAVLNGERLLVVRKRGDSLFILPGGKPEGTEGDLEALSREVKEELGCAVGSPSFAGVFSNRAAGVKDAAVVVRLYCGELHGIPTPQAEIEELAWVDIRKPRSLPLAPSIAEGILPKLRKRLQRNTRQLSQPTPQLVQRSLELL